VGAPDTDGIDLDLPRRAAVGARESADACVVGSIGRMPTKLAGTIHTYPTHALYVGPLLASSRHRHHAGQLVWAPEGLDLTCGEGAAHHATTHVVPPHTPHGHGGTRIAAVLWVDRDDVRWGPPIDHGARALTDVRLEDAHRPEVAASIGESMLAWVASSGARAPARHPAVTRMRRWLDADPTEGTRSLTELAAQSGLSVRQLRHRFTEALGINPSGYLRWRKLRRALTAIERGASLTEGAVEGGFADGAHFSRVFQAQFGLAPSRALASLVTGTSRPRTDRR
jgi:AraC-like DNA-binding protein